MAKSEDAPRPLPKPTRDRKAAERSGRQGEERAAMFLRSRGWRILDQRVRTAAGEIDIVAKRQHLIAFVEVKTRRVAAELDFAVDEHRLARVAAAAELLAPRYATAGEDIRIDVVLIAPGRPPRHIENALIG